MIEELVELRNTWWWPKHDVRCWDWINKHYDLPEKLSNLVDNKRVVVQAGGNCGVYPKIYSSIFQHVYTYEPEWINFYCLTRNASENNIVKTQGCLGNIPKLVDLSLHKKNIGKNYISGDGQYPIHLIDNLNLNFCDLIHLDIEGYEYYALLGAEETIKKFKPLIALEMWDELDNRFESNVNSKTEKFLSDLGYKYLQTLNGSDKVYKHYGNT